MTYDCQSCGLSIDRDLNASINLSQLWPLTLALHPP
ncbi:MAG: zinc ribbon domain-containing protein [Crocosphaera sp.]